MDTKADNDEKSIMVSLQEKITLDLIFWVLNLAHRRVLANAGGFDFKNQSPHICS